MAGLRAFASAIIYCHFVKKTDIDVAVVEDRKEKLPTLCAKFYMDERGLFFCTTENKTLHQKSQEYSGGKKAEIRLTISRCASMVGDKETSLVISKSLNPRCFKRINKKTLLVEYHANKEAWIKSDIFET